MPWLPLARQSKEGIDGGAGYSGERLVNYIPRVLDSTSPLGLMTRGALVRLTATNGGPVRALQRQDGNLYAATGGKLYKVTPAGVATNLGTIADDPETYMAATATEVLVVANGQYFVWDGTSITSPSTGAVTTPRGVMVLDSFAIVWGNGANRKDFINHSAADDPTTFRTLDVVSAERDPDEIRRCIAYQGQIYVFGAETIEGFYNTGSDTAVFRRNTSVILEHGCLDGRTVQAMDSRLLWVDDRRLVRESNGNVIATSEVTEDLKDSTIDGSLQVMDRGSEMYLVHRADDTAWAYDLRTGLWFEFSTGLEYGPFMATCSEVIGGTYYFGAADGGIYRLTKGTYTEDGDEMLSEFVTPAIEQASAKFTISEVELQMAVGRAPGEGQIMAQFGPDGLTWGSEKWRSLGSTGAYSKRVRWNALGQWQRFHMRGRITDAVDRDIHGVRYA